MLGTTSKVAQIFEYLLAVRNLNEKIDRKLIDYERIWWLHELVEDEGCYIAGRGSDEAAWLEVHKQEIPPKLVLPFILKQWVEYSDSPDKNPEVIKSRLIGNEDQGEHKKILFEDDPKRVAAYNEWYRHQWEPWAQVASRKMKIQRLYNELFTLYQRFQREGELLELAWGHGLLNWSVGSEKIERPFFVTPLELQFEAKKGVFKLYPTSKGTTLELDMLNNLDIPNIRRLQQMERQVGEIDLNVWDRDSLTPLLREIVHTIHPQGRYVEDEKHRPQQPRIPVVTYTPVLFLRYKNNRVWQRELLGILEKLRNGFPVSDPVQLLATTDTEQIISRHQQDKQWAKSGEQLLFPLPANEEQKLIAQKLATQPGVVVQGPPGTGKSHTIANLISHLLAHGKRVLVTSEKEPALRVLKEKIPPEIRSLCVSLLGGDSKSLKELETTIKNIAEGMDSRQPEIIQKNISRMKRELDETRRQMAKLQKQINDSAEGENKRMTIDDLVMTPLEMSKWLAANKRHDWFPDSPNVDQPFPLTSDELKHFITLLNDLEIEDIQQLQQYRPSTDSLPSPSQFEENAFHVKQLANQAKEQQVYYADWTLSEIPSNLDQLIKSVDQAITILPDPSTPWLHMIIEDIVSGGERGQMWTTLANQCHELIAEWRTLRQTLIQHSVTVPEEKEQFQLIQDLQKLKDHLARQKGTGWLFRNITGRKLAYLLDQCRIDGRPIQSEQDCDIILDYLKIEELSRKIALVWNRHMAEVNGPEIKSSDPRFIIKLEEYLYEIVSLLTWPEKMEQLRSQVEVLGLPENPQWTKRDWFKKLKKGLLGLKIKRQYQQAMVFFQDLKNQLIKGKEAHHAHESWDQLFQACEELNEDKWNLVYQELLRFEGMEADYAQFVKYRSRLKETCPRWQTQLETTRQEGQSVDLPEDVFLAWKWKKVDAWLNELRKQPSIEQLEQELTLLRKTESRLIRQLVAESTWLAQIKRTTSAQKRSLHAWLNAIKRIGKGTGKYANMYRKEAQKEMTTCKDAIPVWIMPIQKVVENIELNTNFFDVIIVDESSQSNLMSLCVLLRGKKAVIVGDDNQISPESVGINVAEVHELIERHLTDIPQKKRFEMTTSLYDIANQIFEGKILLREHFRCVPEIIQFSNDLMYGGKMDPLRIPHPDEMIEPPVLAVRVEEGYREEHTTKQINRPEAEAIVDYIEKICSNPKLKDKTIGVISLQQSDQARLIENMLRERIGEEEMLERKLLCGDAYTFQGDERDIILLSMVVATNMRIGALTKASDMRRFNVASSRARDQMILFHSVDLNDLNPNCVRYQLLNYCLNPARVQTDLEQYEHEFDSQFEKDVFRLISARGYRVVPQFKVGTAGKRIDLVVEGMRNRLAVECDGDRWHGLEQWEADMERQRVLERVGWTFWRVRGSDFYLDPEKAMEPLWKKLAEMGIEPAV
ncbi:very-short-patch-repair endonuclease/MinD-like ATPase involved in chromosome partitioning or flagellar assembly [Caldalkalibacillus uzonensis]|uniref:Very-short-patch-repair endonuclease/MinD-like ATPase involved in chromosome partitioning or flagellar assembly n=1 Tax=Caldalkalibacillus uzonensis TaxID=353224 RepID=A0ABU0CQT3_9BACI|nr:AAA domain-containing protein [Caldalkalibacillus uzonensis]MDQ0338765.1 very-short-patch-repair endonuclease/MinD-like ATPase involved in chromosome partitioning or flagellar assembly [Caldalkalibacillus uzonensis]